MIRPDDITAWWFGIPTPLKNMSSSVGIIPIYGNMEKLINVHLLVNPNIYIYIYYMYIYIYNIWMGN